jgi:hypothetical protein
MEPDPAQQLDEEPLLSTEAFMPHPLDRKIVGGVALYGALTDEQRLAVVERLDEAFAAMRTDRSDQFGASIAYHTDFDVVGTADIEDVLLTAARAQNHGMFEEERHVTDTANGSFDMWVGSAERVRFFLRKYQGPLPMDDGSLPEAVIYSLHAGKDSRSF